MAAPKLICAIFLTLATLLTATDPEILHVGIMSSLSEGTSPRIREAFAPEFSTMVKDFTGYKAVTLQGLDPFTAARQLESGKWHLGVFQGVEFAWIQAQHPKLKPLMTAIFQTPEAHALVAVKKESEFKKFPDLKGRNAVILETKLHCRLFADKSTGGRAKDFFAKLFQSKSGEEALDDILLGKVDVAIVDNTALHLYKDVNPGRFNRLAIIAQSEPFPPAAVVYQAGTLSDTMLKTLKDGMMKANQSDKGREAMATFQLTSFETVPADYRQQLEKIAKAYPAPPH